MTEENVTPLNHYRVILAEKCNIDLSEIDPGEGGKESRLQLTRIVAKDCIGTRYGSIKWY